MRIVRCLLLGLVVAGMTAWGAGAIYYSPLPSETLRAVLAGAFVIATALGFLRCHAAVTRWLHLTPDLQIIHPAGKSVNTTVVGAVRMKVEF